jgi:hypothetical protein
VQTLFSTLRRVNSNQSTVGRQSLQDLGSQADPGTQIVSLNPKEVPDEQEVIQEIPKEVVYG